MKFSGGNGATATSLSTGGGGGSSAGTAANGNSSSVQAGATAPTGGGNGGSGGNAGFLVGAGTAGSLPGGGGGGAERSNTSGNQNGGNGANGRVVVSFSYPAGTCWPANSATALVDNGCNTAQPYSVPFVISGQPTTLGTAPGNARLLSVELIISHAWNNDLDITLTSPAGQTRNLVLDRFGNGDNLGNPASCPGSAFVLQDGGTALSNTNTSNVTGTYAPEQTLSGFTGDPNGTWTLTICDDATDDVGHFRYAKLNFCSVPLITGTTSNSPFCSTEDLTLGVTATGSPAVTYAWTGTGTFSPNAASADVTVSGANTGNYTITVSNSCG
ncbi:MAG: proprotein convertase P-domain-containing protein, partial [Flavobacteriales bacterium]|nr:proprotein convertase P-domain-containing protein [Flavobacteriales bacterium]